MLGSLASLSRFSGLCGCCKPASGNTVRGKSGTVAATNQGATKIQNWRVILWYQLTWVVLEKICKMVLVVVTGNGGDKARFLQNSVF